MAFLPIFGVFLYYNIQQNPRIYKGFAFCECAEKNLYVAGTLAGWRSQFAIASGSGAHVATDILSLWNGGKHTKVHDKVEV